MGFFKDVNSLRKMGNEIQRTSDPGADLRRARASMSSMNEAMAGQAALLGDPADAVDGTVQVVRVGPTVAMVNMDPMLQVELLVLGEGLVPVPAPVQLVVPMAHMVRMVPGASLPARISRSDPSTFVVRWDAVSPPPGPVAGSR